MSAQPSHAPVTLDRKAIDVQPITSDTGSGASRAAILLIASVPLVASALTWSSDGTYYSWQLVIRIMSLIAVGCALNLIIDAYRQGFALRSILRTAPLPVKVVAALWFTVALVSVLKGGASMTGFSALITARYLTLLLAFLAMIHLIRTDKDFNAIHWFGILALSGTAYIALLWIFAFVVPHPPKFSWLNGFPSATSIRHIANYVAILTIAPLSIAAFKQGRLRWAALGAIALMFGFIGWSGSRAPLLALVIATVVLATLFRQFFAPSAKRLIATAMVAGLAVSAPLPVPAPHEMGLASMISSSIPSEENQVTGGVSGGRTKLWKATIDAIKHRPLIGHGAGRFGSDMYQRHRFDFDNPHSLTLQYLYDWGFIGGLCGLFMVGFLGRMVWLKANADPMLGFAAIAGFILLIVIGHLEGMLYHPIKMLLSAAMIAPALARYSRN